VLIDSVINDFIEISLHPYAVPGDKLLDSAHWFGVLKVTFLWHVIQTPKDCQHLWHGLQNAYITCNALLCKCSNEFAILTKLPAKA